jgi:predicted aminopeptidase
MTTKPKPYRATSLPAAQREVRALRKRLTEFRALLDRYAANLKQCEADRRELAKLAAKGPAFDNPLRAFAAETLRDQVLLHECRLNPDGKFVG